MTAGGARIMMLLFNVDPYAETQLDLTDGWYSVRAVIDEPLAALVSDGKILIGKQPVQHVKLC